MLRRTLLSTAILAFSTKSFGQPASSSSPPPPAPDWLSLAHNRLLNVDIQRALFQDAGHPHFYIRVRLTNPLTHAVGVDLRNRQRTIYPNQWGGSTTPNRQVIDERRATILPLDSNAMRQLRSDFEHGVLTMISPENSIDFYAEFNASDRAAVDLVHEPYVIVSIAGELRFTDGRFVEQLAFDFSPRANHISELLLATPVAWQSIPTGSLVIAG